jgi:hypothetical protein
MGGQSANNCSERAQKLPSGWFNWVIPFWKTPDIEVLNRSSLEGYLFLRYLKVLTIICCVGLLLTWPILIPIHALGGMGSQQLDKLTFGNVAHPTWLYAHALIAWVYFGMACSRIYSSVLTIQGSFYTWSAENLYTSLIFDKHTCSLHITPIAYPRGQFYLHACRNKY